LHVRCEVRYVSEVARAYLGKAGTGGADLARNAGRNAGEEMC
jgi:hypothetical protein